MANFSPEQVLALAPDPASAKAGQSLSSTSKWLNLSQSDRAVWGECQGSGATPYQTQIDLFGPAFKCSCPSRKFPCKHGIGLLLAFTQKPERFIQSTPPDGVIEWLEKRDNSAAKQSASLPAERTAAQLEESKKEAQRRAAKREHKVKEGLQELEVWLGDLIRQGLARAQQQSMDYWDAMAARLVDSQAPGLARRIQTCSSIIHSGGNWTRRLMDKLSRIHLLIEGTKRINQLPDTIQMDIRTSIGWTIREEEVLQQTGIRDQWLVQGYCTEEEEVLRVHRTWLLGLTTKKPALLLSFAAPGQPAKTLIPPGTLFEATLAFYPSNAPLRAIIKQKEQDLSTEIQFEASSNFDIALSKCAGIWACNPWIELLPVSVSNCLLVCQDREWFLVDQNSTALPILPRFQQPWHFLASSGGHPCTAFGEWDGENFLPLSLVNIENRLIFFESHCP